MSTYSPTQWSKGFALFGGIAFIACFLWSYTIGDTALHSLHVDMFRMSFFAFSGINIASFIAGLIQSILWGLISGWALAKCLNYFK